MISRQLGAALSCSFLLLSGCGKKSEPEQREPQPSLKRVTLHVQDMAATLDLL